MWGGEEEKKGRKEEGRRERMSRRREEVEGSGSQRLILSPFGFSSAKEAEEGAWEGQGPPRAPAGLGVVCAQCPVLAERPASCHFPPCWVRPCTWGCLHFFQCFKLLPVFSPILIPAPPLWFQPSGSWSASSSLATLLDRALGHCSHSACLLCNIFVSSFPCHNE